MIVTAKWTGLEEAMRKVSALGKELSEEEVLGPALVKTGQPLRDDLQRTAPRSPDAPHVADTFVVKLSKEEREFGRVTVLVGPKPGYPGVVAPFLEFGTSKMSPRPWIRAAYDAFKGGFPRELTTHLQSQYQRVVKKYTVRAK